MKITAPRVTAPTNRHDSPKSTSKQAEKKEGAGSVLLPVQRRDAPPDAPNRQESQANFARAFSSSGGQSLPVQLQSGVEQLSGISMNDVQVHYNSPKPVQLQALAYTQGSNIYVGPGEERHLAHEAWHVVQQKQGRVAPTTQFKGQSINADRSLEHEADVMGARAAEAGRSIPQGETPTGQRAGSYLRTAVTQCRGQEVIQAVSRTTILHNKARRPQLHNGDEYFSRKLDDGKTRWYLRWEPSNYPHLNTEALDVYENIVERDPDASLSAKPAWTYENVLGPYKKYFFTEKESDSLFSIHISHGDQIITMTPRNPAAFGRRAAKAQKLLEQTGNPKMGEEDAQHLGTHIPGTPGGGFHQHFYNQQGIDPNVVGLMIERLEDEGIIGTPRVNIQGVPQPPEKLQEYYPNMDEPLAVGARLRDALEVPARQSPPVSLQVLKNRFKDEQEESKRQGLLQEQRLKAKSQKKINIPDDNND